MEAVKPRLLRKILGKLFGGHREVAIQPTTEDRERAERLLNSYGVEDQVSRLESRLARVKREVEKLIKDEG